jgi:transposase
MTLKIGWLHEAEQSLGTWLHEADDWHPSDDRPRLDPIYLHTELRRPGVTLEVLHLEYLEQHPTGLRYTAFCDVYRRWLATASVTMRQVHKAGEKCFVDSGKTPGREPSRFAETLIPER